MSEKIAIIGAGILGLSLAYKIQLIKPNSKVIVFEKEDTVGKHQSGRNSGVLHCGLYYEPNSLKANLAVSGIRQMTEFCKRNKIQHDICGKVVVATDDEEVKYLENLGKRGNANGLKGLKYLSKKELYLREPNVVAKKSLIVPEEGIVDYKAVMNKLSEIIINKGGDIILSSQINKIENSKNKIIINCNNNEYVIDLLLNCTGLFSDRNFKKYLNKKSPVKIIPFRGEYFKLKKDYNHLVNDLIYPVPNPRYPFLGVHFTRMINGDREVGPNAVLAFKREGYSNKDFSINDSFDTLTYPGLFKFVNSNFNFCLNELKSSFFSKYFIEKAKKMIPDINSNMFVKGNSGVRAQGMDSNGKLLMDFNIIKENNQIHILNAPSPGATASLSIADYIIKNNIN
ncbi:L-2-hydroxyglutarate oxidase [Flavobacteriaceae bacterium]|nr:L-2-hydroxyglutarate oxidase [Flavobacteriaceae bacterium]